MVRFGTFQDHDPAVLKNTCSRDWWLFRYIITVLWMTGIRYVRLCVALRYASHHLCLLLPPYLSCRQTPGKGQQWSGS